MRGSILKTKLKWLSIFEIILGSTYLLAFGISGSNNVAFHVFIIVLSILIEPIVVVISYHENEKKPCHHKNDTNEKNNRSEKTAKQYKCAYGSRYENLHVHF